MSERSAPHLIACWVYSKAKELFIGGHTTLWKVVREMGFHYKKHEKGAEQPRTIQQWHDYLCRLRKNHSPTEDHPVVYLETWVNAHHRQDTMWVDGDGDAGWKCPSGKGGWLIVLHAGTANGWVDGAEQVFRAKSSTTMKWIRRILCDGGTASSCPIYPNTPSLLWITPVTTMVLLREYLPRAKGGRLGWRAMESVTIPKISKPTCLLRLLQLSPRLCTWQTKQLNWRLWSDASASCPLWAQSHQARLGPCEGICAEEQQTLHYGWGRVINTSWDLSCHAWP